MKYIKIYEKVDYKFKIGDYVRIKTTFPSMWLPDLFYIDDFDLDNIDGDGKVFHVYTVDNKGRKIRGNEGWVDKYQLKLAEDYLIQAIKYNL